jgi:hypothetical protein
MRGDHRCRIPALESRKPTTARLPRRRLLPAPRGGGEPAALRYLRLSHCWPARALPLVMWIAAEGGQAMLEEVSVVVRGHLGSPRAAALVLRSAPEAGSLKCRDSPGW